MTVLFSAIADCWVLNRPVGAESEQKPLEFASRHTWRRSEWSSSICMWIIFWFDEKATWCHLKVARKWIWGRNYSAGGHWFDKLCVKKTGRFTKEQTYCFFDVWSLSSRHSLYMHVCGLRRSSRLCALLAAPVEIIVSLSKSPIKGDRFLWPCWNQRQGAMVPWSSPSASHPDEASYTSPTVVMMIKNQ